MEPAGLMINERPRRLADCQLPARASSFEAELFSQQPLKTRIEEKELVGRLQTAEPKAIGILYDNYSGALYDIIKRIVIYDEVAEDALQDTFVKAWRSIRQFDAEKGRLFTWLARVARHTALDELRKRYNRNEKQTDRIIDSQACLKVAYLAERPTDTIGLKSMALNLPLKYSAILELIYFQGFTHTEVAEQLCIPVGTVKTRLFSAIRQLRNNFNKGT